MNCKIIKTEIGPSKKLWISIFTILAGLVSVLNISCGGKLKQDRRKLFHSENNDHSVPQFSLGPQFAIILPIENSYINMKNDSPNFEISGICPEPKNLLSEDVNIIVDGQSIENIAQCKAGVFSATFDSTRLSEGIHTFIAQMKGVAGQSLNSHSVMVKKDTQAPQLTLNTPANLKIMSSLVNGKVNFSGTCLDSENEVQIEVLGESSEQSRSVSCPTGVWNSELDFSGANEGSLIYVISLKDDAGNEEKLQQTLINDITSPAAPKAVLLYSDKTQTLHTTLTFSPDILILTELGNIPFIPIVSDTLPSEPPENAMVQFRLVKIENPPAPGAPTVLTQIINWTDLPKGDPLIPFRLGGLGLLNLANYAIEARTVDLAGNVSATTSSNLFFTKAISQSPFAGLNLDNIGVQDSVTLTDPITEIDSKNIYPRANPFSARNLLVQGQVKYQWLPFPLSNNHSAQQTANGHSAIFINTKNLDLQNNAQFVADGYAGSESSGAGYTNIGVGASGGGASGANGGSDGENGFANPKYPNIYGAAGSLLGYNQMYTSNFFPFGLGGSGGAGLGRLNCVNGNAAFFGLGGTGGYGGGGGGGGSSDYCMGAWYGGGGGGGGGLIVIESYNVSGTAQVRAKGGDGGPEYNINGNSSYGLHPGGGGGGGTVWLASKIYSGNYFVNVSGGAGVQNGTAGKSLVFQINSDGSYTERLASDSWTLDGVAITNDLPFAISQLPNPKLADSLFIDFPQAIPTNNSLQNKPTLINQVNISSNLSHDPTQPNAVYVYLDELIMAPNSYIIFSGKRGQDASNAVTLGGDGGFAGAAGGNKYIGGSGGSFDKLAGNPPILTTANSTVGFTAKSWAFEYINSDFKFGKGGRGGDAQEFCTGNTTGTPPTALGGIGGEGAGGGGAGGAGCTGMPYYGASGGGGGGLVVIVANKISLNGDPNLGSGKIVAKGGNGGNGFYNSSYNVHIGGGGGGGGGVVWIATKSYTAGTLQVNVNGGSGGNFGGLPGTDGTARIFQILPNGKLVQKGFGMSW